MIKGFQWLLLCKREIIGVNFRAKKTTLLAHKLK